MTEGIDFSKYGKSFQESLAQLIFEDRPFCDQIEEVLDINFFELKYLRAFIERVFDYRKQYGIHPSINVFTSILRTELEHYSPALQKQVRDYYVRCEARDVRDKEYIKDTSLDFCKKQKLKAALVQSVELIRNSSFDEVKQVIDEALKLGTDNNFGHDFIKDFEARYEIKARNPITTGWDKVDKILKKGLGSGELGVVIAPTGAGKSMALAHIGSAAIRDGKNIVHYTLELSEAVTGQRYDSCTTGVPLNQLFDRKDEVLENITDFKGSLVIKEYPTKTASPNTIKKHLEKLKKQNRKIDMIIVDYADLLRSAKAYKEKRNELESIYEDLRAIAQEQQCPIWTASQTNRSGLNAEVVTMESISEAFNKCFVADFICSISRTIKDKNSNQARMFIAKNRNGPDGLIFSMHMDTSCVKLQVIDKTEIGNVLPASDPGDLNQKLKDKYKKYRQQGVLS
jgi:archaellum biogenesis ATPase FlaH